MMLLASVSDAKLMPVVPNDSYLVVNAQSSYVRSNAKWIIDRLVRDYESWMDAAVKKRLDEMLEERVRFIQQKARKGTKIPKPG
jgi:hypothetical protein